MTLLFAIRHMYRSAGSIRKCLVIVLSIQCVKLWLKPLILMNLKVGHVDHNS